MSTIMSVAAFICEIAVCDSELVHTRSNPFDRSISLVGSSSTFIALSSTLVMSASVRSLGSRVAERRPLSMFTITRAFPCVSLRFCVSSPVAMSPQEIRAAARANEPSRANIFFVSFLIFHLLVLVLLYNSLYSEVAWSIRAAIYAGVGFVFSILLTVCCASTTAKTSTIFEHIGAV